MREFMTAVKALADENRVRILMALRTRELCVCQIIDMLGLAPSTVSKHISILKNARLVDSRKDGRWVYYRPAAEDAMPPASSAVWRMIAGIEGDAVILRDAHRLNEICGLICGDSICP